MTTANNVINVTSLDFTDIKASIKAYLKSQVTFSDYDFEGSNMSVLLDILAYNTHYNAFYTNMLANEMFLDTALIRDSVVSRAKELNYTPSSARSAVATVDVTIVPDDAPSTILIPTGTQFTATSNNVVYTFVTDTDYTIVPVDGIYTKEIDIYEGVELSESFVATSSTSRYIISNSNVDMNSIIVTVSPSVSDTAASVYSKADDINNINGSSKVYYIQEGENEQFEIYFGNGTFGSAISIGNVVNVSYRVCNDTAVNGVDAFTSTGSIEGYSDVSVETVTAASGGAKIESIDSIKFRAPKQFEIQNRAVTARDYERIILKENSDINSVSVWGGEDNDPIRYGVVFVSLKGTSAAAVAKSRKESIKNTLLSRNIVTMSVEFVDPEFMYINLLVSAKYNPGATTKTVGQMKTTILSAITTFETDTIGKFNKSFRLSRFQRYLDNSEKSMLSNEVDITLELEKIINTTLSDDYEYNFNREIDSVSSTAFTYGGYSNCAIGDDGTGILTVYYKNSDDEQVVVDYDIGTVDYTTGLVTLVDFQPTSLNETGSILGVIANPTSNDIVPTQKQILVFGTKEVTLTEESDDAGLVSGNY